MPTRTSRPGAALTSRSSELVWAEAAVADHSKVTATSHADALIRSRAMFLLAPDFSPNCSNATADSVPCDTLPTLGIGQSQGRHLCRLTREQIHPVAMPS